MTKSEFRDGVWTVLVFLALLALYVVADLGSPS